MQNLATAVDNANHDFFCEKELMLSMFSAINLMKQEIAFRKNYDKIEWLMKIKKDFKNATRCFMCGDTSQKVL